MPSKSFSAVVSLPAADRFLSAVRLSATVPLSPGTCGGFGPFLDRRLAIVVALLLGGLFLWLPQSVRAEQLVRLKSGLTLRGEVIPIPTIDENAFAAAASTNRSLSIWMVDDGLRRVYVHRQGMVAEANPVDGLAQRISLWQPVPTSGMAVAAIGGLLNVTSFNDYGQRITTMRGTDGSPNPIIQGITEINARYTALEALRSGTPNHLWSSRVATSSIPSDQLRMILRQRVDQSDFARRMDVVRFFIEAERLAEARAELDGMISDFPDEGSLITQRRVLVQQQGAQLLAEAQRRQRIGQYQLALDILRSFPLGDVAAVTSLEIQDAIQSIEGRRSSGQRLVGQLRQQIGQTDSRFPHATLLSFVDQIEADLSSDSVARLADYARLGSDTSIDVENRVAMAIGGWLMGPAAGIENLPVAVTLIEIQREVTRYLASQDPRQRAEILEAMRQIEGADASYVAQMLPHLKPPLELPESAQHADDPLQYSLTAEHLQREHGQYILQLPPEYDPLRQYPCIVALAPLGGDPEAQIEFWSGRLEPESGLRLGQGARHGYVVIAPRWTRPHQRQYESTPREHGEVLSALRDAMRRVSIDADRVFIAGLGNGGTAAWDIALSHPELWAGLINIGGDPPLYSRFYTENAMHLPMMFVFGELGGSPPTLARIGGALDRYMQPDYQAMIVNYRGRGPEHFYEEIHHLFAWMNLPTSRRRAMPQNIDAVSMRQGDQFFWWLELEQVDDRIAIDPFLWDHVETPRKGKIVGNVSNTNEVRVQQAPASRVHVYLEPSMGLQIKQPIVVRFRNRSATFQFDGSPDFMLEDARTRADRKRPFWGVVSLP